MLKREHSSEDWSDEGERYDEALRHRQELLAYMNSTDFDDLWSRDKCQYFKSKGFRKLSFTFSCDGCYPLCERHASIDMIHTRRVLHMLRNGITPETIREICRAEKEAYVSIRMRVEDNV